METIINRLLSLKHLEIFIIFTVILFIPIHLTSDNFFNLVFKFVIIMIMTYVYFFSVLIFIKSKLSDTKNKRQFKISVIIFCIRVTTILSLPSLFFFYNLVYKTDSNLGDFVTYFMILVPLIFISSIPWFYFLNFISKNLYFLEKRKSTVLSEYLGYLIAFLFIPIGIFIVQPILNKLYEDSHNFTTVD